MKFLHASFDELDIGTILKPRKNYEEHWKNTDFYAALEKYRPKEMLAHKEAVFMCTSAEDLDNSMGGEFIFEVTPDTRIERHDMNWSSEVSCLVCDNAPEEKIKEAEQIKRKIFLGEEVKGLPKEEKVDEVDESQHDNQHGNTQQGIGRDDRPLPAGCL